MLTLRLVWDPAKFTEKQFKDSALSDNDTKGLNMTALTHAIRSNLWWSYCKMLQIMMRFVGQLGSWAEGCPCHDWLQPRKTDQRGRFFSDEAEHLQQSRRGLGLDQPGQPAGDGRWYGPCPMAGKRAVELALGLLSEQIRELGESFLESVLEVCAGLSPEEVAIVMDDFEHGRAHMIEVLTNKLQQWTVLPWRLVALGDWDMSRLRDTARKILAEFARCPDEAKHHRITLEWLRPGSPLRADIHALPDGETIANLSRLRYRVGEYFFLPTAERRQEGDHSLLHRGSSSRASGPYNSLVLRMPELEKRCKTKAAWRKCSRLYKSLADVKSLAARLGVQRHPLSVRAQRVRRGRRKRLQVLQCVLYSLDAEAQFVQLEGAKNKRKKQAEELKQEAFGKKARTAFSTIAVEDAARVQHIQSMLQPGNLYSVPAAAVQLGRLD